MDIIIMEEGKEPPACENIDTHKETSTEKEMSTKKQMSTEKEMSTKEQTSSSFADLFRNKSVRKNFLCMSFNW